MARRGGARRQRPVEVIGAVRVLAPTGSGPYYRLTWVEPDGRQGRTSGGRTLAQAIDKARGIDVALHATASAPKALTRLLDVIAVYTSTGVGRSNKTVGKDWGETRLGQIRVHLHRCLLGAPGSTASQLDRALIITMQSQGGTQRVVKENTTALRGLLAWGVANGYFTPEQGELLPDRRRRPDPAWPGTPAPTRGRSERDPGEAEDFIGPDDAPDAAQIRALGDQLAVAFPAWGRLAPELASTCGTRWGEQFQLRAEDVVDDGHGGLTLRVDWQISPTAKAKAERRCRPKGGRTRKVPVAATSFTGYPLVLELRARCSAARLERAAGKNPDALLFPARRGGMHWHTSFSTDYLLPAMRRAEWPLTEWVQTTSTLDQRGRRVARTRTRVQAELTWHSLRHRFARFQIDVLGLAIRDLMAIGGWTDQTTVERRYYQTGQEHWEAAQKKIRAHG